jgi:3-deoxy-D-manno-octulosonate 8-phosphate phosphatase (KDO 8-P phosphatase)
MKSKLLKIKLVLMDVDGVLTSGDIIYTSNGDELKFFNVQDGMGITLARMAGLKTGIITGRTSPIVRKRAEELGIDFLDMGSFHKHEPYKTAMNKFELKDEEVCYIGDDVLDLTILRRVGFSVAVANARDEVKAACDYVTIASGGDGAVREVIDKILERQDKLHAIIESLSK